MSFIIPFREALFGFLAILYSISSLFEYFETLFEILNNFYLFNRLHYGQIKFRFVKFL